MKPLSQGVKAVLRAVKVYIYQWREEIFWSPQYVLQQLFELATPLAAQFTEDPKMKHYWGDPGAVKPKGVFTPLYAVVVV